MKNCHPGDSIQQQPKEPMKNLYLVTYPSGAWALCYAECERDVIREADKRVQRPYLVRDLSGAEARATLKRQKPGSYQMCFDAPPAPATKIMTTVTVQVLVDTEDLQSAKEITHAYLIGDDIIDYRILGSVPIEVPTSWKPGDVWGTPG